MKIKSISAIQAAIEWKVLLLSGEVSENDVKKFNEWLSKNEENSAAWSKIQESHRHILSTTQTIEHELRQKNKNRRQLLISAAGVSFSLLIYKSLSYSSGNIITTGIGEQKEISLPDGSYLMLNTDTKVDFEFKKTNTTFKLLKGEILVNKAKTTENNLGALSIITRNGTIRTLKSTIAIRDFGSDDNLISVNLYNGHAVISPDLTREFFLTEGKSVFFTKTLIEERKKIDPNSAAWVEKKIITEQMPLKLFIDELSRYTKSFITITDEISQVTISGTYSTQNVEMTLDLLARMLSINLKKLTPFWFILYRHL